MKLDPDLNIASNEAVFLVTRACEMFIQSLGVEAYTYTAQAKKKTIQKRDLDLAIAAVDSLMFLDGAMTFWKSTYVLHNLLFARNKRSTCLLLLTNVYFVWKVK